MPRRVQIGAVKGETPRKMTYFNKYAPPNDVEIATPLRAEGMVPLKSSLKGLPSSIAHGGGGEDRPTTSRGIARPSPDDFYNYISHSPDRDLLQRKVLVFGDDDKDASESDSISDSEAVDDYDDDDLYNYNTAAMPPPPGINSFDMNVDGANDHTSRGKRNDKAAAVGCWLFGSALAI